MSERQANDRTATKRRMRGPERRAQLLDVARTMFHRHGFHSVTMDTVAKEAGVTKPILYDHFPSKRELYVGLLEEDIDSLRKRVHAALEDSPGNRERIRASIQAYFDFVDDHAEGFSLLMQEAIGAELEFRELVGTFREEVLAEVVDVLLRESRGNLDKDEAETVGSALIGMVETSAQRHPGKPKAEREKDVDVLVRLAWRGITGLA